MLTILHTCLLPQTSAAHSEEEGAGWTHEIQHAMHTARERKRIAEHRPVHYCIEVRVPACVCVREAGREGDEDAARG